MKPDQGEGLYRRSLYTYWKRTGPAPVMMTLDASKRDVCRVRRERTSTPLEAFVLMNGPQFVEAARVLSETLRKQYGDEDQAAFVDLFRTLTGRRPNRDELMILTELHTRQLDYFVSNPGRAAEYLKTGQRAVDTSLDVNRLAALSTVANALLSFDEVVNRSTLTLAEFTIQQEPNMLVPTLVNETFFNDRVTLEVERNLSNAVLNYTLTVCHSTRMQLHMAL